MPQELKNFIHSLPGTLVNNSREIVRQTWDRVTRHFSKYDENRADGIKVANIINSKFGTGLELDWTDKDAGEPPVEWEKI